MSARLGDGHGEVSWRSVAFSYPHAERSLGPIDVDVEAGTTTLVVGNSGSGKSTLLRSIDGLVPHSSGGTLRGEVIVDGRSTATHRPRDLADVVGFVHQTPEAQFVVDHVEHDIAFVLENLGADERTMRRRVEEVLDALGVAHLRDRSPATLSGGERQRCAVAGALAAGPQILVLDEPTSMLDPQGADDVMAALRRLSDDLGTTIVFAEHRLERAAPIADRVVSLVDGRVVDDGDPATVLAALPSAPPVTHLARLLGWSPLPLTVREARALARRFPPDPELLPVPLTNLVWDLAPSGSSSYEVRRGSGSAGSGPGGPLLVARGVEVALGGRTVLRPTTLEVREGEVVALLGRNGAGKTTLLRALSGAQAATAGAVEATVPVAHVPQEPDSLLFQTTVRAEVTSTLELLGRRDPAAVDRWLDRLRLTDLADRHPRSLSVGQRQRVAIAAVAVGDAPVLLLDEPTRGIDATSREALESAIVEHTAAGGAVVVATHDIELAARIATRVVVLGDGEVVAEGDAREVLAGSLFAPQVLRVLPPFLTVAEVEGALARTEPPADDSTTEP